MMDKDLSRPVERWLPVAVFLVAALVYALTLSSHHAEAEDALRYVHEVSHGSMEQWLHPNHLIFNLVQRGFYEVWLGVGYSGTAERPMQVLNLLGGALALLAAWRFGRWCRAQGIRHVHVATPANSLLIAQLAGILFDLTTDVTINAKLEWWGAMYEKLSRCARIFVVAEWMLRQIQRDFDAAIAARTIVARHGVDLRLWNPGDRVGGEHQEEGPIRVVAVGRLHPSKGHQDLLRATALLVASGCSLRRH